MRSKTGLLITKAARIPSGLGVCTFTTSLWAYVAPERTWPAENSLLECDTLLWQSGWQWPGLSVRGRFSCRSWEVVPATPTVRWWSAPLAGSSRGLQHSCVLLYSLILTALYCKPYELEYVYIWKDYKDNHSYYLFIYGYGCFQFFIRPTACGDLQVRIMIMSILKIKRYDMRN